MNTSTTIAALVQTDTVRADAMLYEALHRRKNAGWTIRGLVSVPLAAEPGQVSKNTIVENLHTGERHAIMQSRGKDTRGCRLNPIALTSAGDELRHALGTRPDLAVINRFGTSEAEGGGFCAEIIDLVSAGIPLLLVVTDRYLDAWRHFIGASDYELPCSRPALDAWLDSLPRQAAGETQSLDTGITAS